MPVSEVIAGACQVTENQIGQIIGALTIILAIFGMLYMLKDILTGVTLMGVCGILIFLRAFISKHTS